MHALISITEFTRRSIDKNEFGRGIFINLEEAFDSVNHAILLTKLNHYGIGGNVHELVKSYSAHKEQFAIVSGHDSISLPLTCSIPQGFIFGSLLFL